MIQSQIRPAIRLARLSNNGIIVVCQAMHDAILAAVAVFASPPVSMATFQTNIDAMAAAVQAYGVKGVRGSKQQHTDVLVARTQLKADATALCNYGADVSRTNSSDPTVQKANMALGRIRAKNGFQKQPINGSPRNARQLLKKALHGTGKVYCRWQRPAISGETAPPKGYNIEYSITGSPAGPWQLVRSTTACNMTIQATNAAFTWYRVRALNSRGDGGYSDVFRAIGQ